MAESFMTERQEKWFASVKAGLERDTGRTLEQWAEIARTCPETKPRARLAWFKETHGLLQNRASIILAEAFPSPKPWREADQLVEALWTDSGSRAIYEAVKAAVEALPGEVVVGPRKGFTSFSRTFQFASVKPVKGGAARLGLAVEPQGSPRLQPPRNEGWSERLKSALPLASPTEVDGEVAEWLREAWERS